MKYTTLKDLLFLILAIVLGVSCNHPKAWTVQNKELTERWLMQSSAKIKDSGKEISTNSFDTSHWFHASVPGTVLGSLVADSVYKNIFYHRNLTKIPDSLFDVPWWYRTTFNIDQKDSEQVYRLRFNGISYRADIWLNGQKIASSDTLEGSFRQFILDVSPFIKSGKNVLALKITHAKPGELGIGFVDWNPEPADHNMGIWREVHLLVTGPVSIDQPFIHTRVDTATLDYATIMISIRLENHSNKPIQGKVTGTIGKDISFYKIVNLQPHQSKKVRFPTQEYKQLYIHHPRLWWVHTLGKPNLYNLHLKFTANNGLSDSLYTRFGIRQVSDYMTRDGHRGFKLNGKKILIKGGGWTDPMLLNATPAYEKAGIDYALQMNLNALRMEGFWGENQHLYNMCDEKGLLIMVGFSCQWEWKEYLGSNFEDQYSAFNTPKQNDIAAESWKDQIVWLRNHPSIFVWLYGSDKRPRPSLEKRYLDVLKEYDPTRPALNSAADYTPGIANATKHISELSGPSGVKMRGPYDYVPPDYWYIDTAHGGAFGFNTETGPGPEMPVLESLKKMIPADSLWPIGSAWMYHAARHNFYNLTNYTIAMNNRLGKPKNLKDYLRKAQFLNYEGMRAMFEAFEANRFKATGIIQWMFNASWPKLWWQLYDYYLMPTGAFYGARKANEPVHISYNYGKNAVDLMNNTAQDKHNLTAEVSVLDFNLKPVLKKTISADDLKAQSTSKIFKLPNDLSLTKTWFVDLRLYNSKHQLVSKNFYALSTQKDELDEAKSNWYITPESQYADLKLLQQLPPVKLNVNQAISQKGDTTFVKVQLKNPTKHLAFMVHLDLKNSKTDKSVVPVFWDANYITLLPGEQREITVHCHTKDLRGSSAKVAIDGWNINE